MEEKGSMNQLFGTNIKEGPKRIGPTRLEILQHRITLRWIHELHSGASWYAPAGFLDNGSLPYRFFCLLQGPKRGASMHRGGLGYCSTEEGLEVVKNTHRRGQSKLIFQVAGRKTRFSARYRMLCVHMVGGKGM